MVDGKQYISIAAGWGGGYGMKKKFAPIQTGRVFTFVLNGTAPMPAFNKAVPLTLPETKFTATAAEFAHGETLFWQYCGTCHVVNGGGGGMAPDLAYSVIAANSESILSIAHKGAYLPLGMPKFGDRLSEKDILDIQKYILTKASEAKEKK